MNSCAELIGFCSENIGNKVKILFKDRTIYGKIIDIKIDEVIISKEENFYIVGHEGKKFSSKYRIKLNSVNEISLVLDKK